MCFENLAGSSKLFNNGWMIIAKISIERSATPSIAAGNA
jgi:hypothetical protein